MLLDSSEASDVEESTRYLQGAYLTFRNIHYSIEGKVILKDISGFVKPGMMIMIIGHPGSGKTTLFDILAGTRRHGELTGELLVNGKPRDQYYSRMIGYVSQRDIHLPNLTVRETVEFSAALRLRSSVSPQARQELVNNTLKMVGLSHVADNIVGNNMIRGVSGGERKRVTIAVEAVLNRSILFLDEPTTGLDSAAAYDVIRATKNLSETGVGVVCSLLQAGVELFGLFDTLLLLSHGEICYFGPSLKSIEYFNGLGLRCPPMKNPAEFLQEVTDNPMKFQEYRPGEKVKVVQTKHLVRAYKKSPYYEDVGKSLWQGIVPEKVTSLVVDYGSKYALPTYKQFIEINRRSMKILSKSAQLVRQRLVRSIIVGLLTGSLFWNLGKDQSDADTRMGLLFFAMAFAGMGSLQAIPSLIEERDVFFHQRNTYYFRTRAYFLSTLIFELPVTFLEMLFFSSIVYTMSGLQSGVEKFVVFMLALFGTKISSNALCRTVAAISPTILVANILAPATVALMYILTGFLLPAESIPDYWKWLYHISMFRYGFETIAVNEMIDLEGFTCTEDQQVVCDGVPLDACFIQTGKDVLANYDMETEDENHKYLLLTAIFAIYGAFSMSTYFALQYLRPVSKVSNKQGSFLRRALHGNSFGRRRASSAKEDDVISMKSYKGYGAMSEHTMESHASLPDVEREGNEPLIKRQTNYGSAQSAAVARGAYMSFNNIRYELDVPLDRALPRDRLPGGKYFMKKVPTERKIILKGVSGYVRPGMLVSLMGPSGAGKSTLLDILANRKTGGHITGEILINGKPRNKYFPRMSGYVEQQDIHLETQTVREAVLFSAMLRLPAEMSAYERDRLVYDILHEVGLLEYEDKVVGLPGFGLSLELRKKLTIAVELVTNPVLLFLDEPTSGLDSGAAENIMKLIRDVSNRGRSVICTIHQPGVEIFRLFDWLLLLNGRGQQVYFGPMGDQCSTVLGYIEGLGTTCPPYKNPADFILEVTGAGIDARNYEHIDAVKAFQESRFKRDVDAKLLAGISPVGVEPAEYSTTFARSGWVQFKEVFLRAFKNYARRPAVRRARNMRSLMMGLVVGSMFFGLEDDQEGARSRVCLVYFCMSYSLLGAVSSLSVLISDREVYYRERAAGCYGSLSYFMASVLVEIPFAFTSMMVFLVIFYPMIGFRWGDSGEYFMFFVLCYFMTNMVGLAFCQMVAAVSPTVEVATAMGTTGMTVFTLFAGFLIPKDSIPEGWIWMYYLSFLRYPLVALTINEVSDLNIECSKQYNGTDCDCPINTGEDILEKYDMPTDEGEKWWFLGGLFLFYVGYLLLFYIGLVKVNHLKR